MKFVLSPFAFSLDCIDDPFFLQRFFHLIFVALKKGRVSDSKEQQSLLGAFIAIMWRGKSQNCVGQGTHLKKMVPEWSLKKQGETQQNKFTLQKHVNSSQARLPNALFPQMHDLKINTLHFVHWKGTRANWSNMFDNSSVFRGCLRAFLKALCILAEACNFRRH